jgi:hypothetical protein
MGILTKGMIFRVTDVDACWNKPDVSEEHIVSTFKVERRTSLSAPFFQQLLLL